MRGEKMFLKTGKISARVIKQFENVGLASRLNTLGIDGVAKLSIKNRVSRVDDMFYLDIPSIDDSFMYQLRECAIADKALLISLIMSAQPQNRE